MMVVIVLRRPCELLWFMVIIIVLVSAIFKARLLSVLHRDQGRPTNPHAVHAHKHKELLLYNFYRS